jgi:hypothetical protein
MKQLPVGGDTWVYLGKWWVEGITDEYGARVYLNRRSGRIRRFPPPSEAFADPPVRDLDDPKLRVVCIDPGYLDTNDARFYDGAYAVSEPTHGAARYVLHRSCDAKGRLLDMFGDDQTWPFVDAGWVTWGTRGNAYAVNLATKKRRRWSVPHYRGDIRRAGSRPDRRHRFLRAAANGRRHLRSGHHELRPLHRAPPRREMNLDG